MHLTIDVGFGDHVQIDQRDPADGRTCQCFGSPGTDAADADDGDMRALKALQRGRTVQARDTREATLHVGRCQISHRLSAARRIT
jgi:hypothetical protein